MQENQVKKTGFVLLTAGAGFLAMMMLSYPRGVLMMETYGSAVMFLFGGLLLLSGKWRKNTDLIIGLGVIGWFILSRVLMGELYLEHSWLYLANLMCVYTMALPYAQVTGDAERFRGLRMTAWVFFLCFAVMAWVGTAAVLLDRQIVLPVLGTDFGLGTDKASVDYRRLRLGTIGNLSAAMVLAGLILGCWLLADRFSARRAIPFSVLFLGMYSAVAFTGSRTVMLQIAFWAAGITVALLMKMKLCKWKKLLVCAAAGAAVFVVVFSGFSVVVAAQEGFQAAAEGVKVMQRPLGKDLVTMTGRTKIYAAVIELIKDRPQTLLTGMLHSDIVQSLRRYYDAPHAHNAYLQMVLNMGIPGLLAALWFTGRTLRASFRVFFLYADRALLKERMLALAAVTMLISAIPEVFLFCEYFTMYNFAFFLIYGYLTAVEKRLRVRA